MREEEVLTWVVEAPGSLMWPEAAKLEKDTHMQVWGGLGGAGGI